MTQIYIKPTEKYIESYKKASKAYYERSKEAILAKASIYYEKNKEAILAKKKEQYASKRALQNETNPSERSKPKKNYYQEVYKVKRQKDKEEQLKNKLIELGINEPEIILNKFIVKEKNIV